MQDSFSEGSMPQEDVAESEDEEYNETSHTDRRKPAAGKKTNKKPVAKSKKSSVTSSPVIHLDDPVVIPMGSKEFEKILNWRLHPENPTQEELLVKYKHMSYNAAEWVPKERIES